MWVFYNVHLNKGGNIKHSNVFFFSEHWFSLIFFTVYMYCFDYIHVRDLIIVSSIHEHVFSVPGKYMCRKSRIVIVTQWENINFDSLVIFCKCSYTFDRLLLNMYTMCSLYYRVDFQTYLTRDHCAFIKYMPWNT